jgi:hypothetical protein
MELWHFALVGAALAVLGIGIWRRPRTIAFTDAQLAAAKDAVAKHGFTVESYDHAPGGLIRGFGVRLDDRVVGSVTPKGATVIVHGMKPPPGGAMFRVGRMPLDAATIVKTGDDAFDAKHVVNGAPADVMATLLARTAVRGAIAQLFTLDDVVEVRVLQLGNLGGGVKVDATSRDSLRVIATSARALADAIEP